MRWAATPPARVASQRRRVAGAGVVLFGLVGGCAWERGGTRAPAVARIVVVDASGGAGIDARATRGATP